MPTLKNKGKIRMPSQVDASSTVNTIGTCQEIDALLTQPGSRHVLRSRLDVMRREHGPTSSVGHHLSNLLELVDLPTPPAHLLKQQIRGLQRAMGEG